MPTSIFGLPFEALIDPRTNNSSRTDTSLTITGSSNGSPGFNPDNYLKQPAFEHIANCTKAKTSAEEHCVDCERETEALLQHKASSENVKQQVLVTVNRLTACISTNPELAGTCTPLLHELIYSFSACEALFSANIGKAPTLLSYIDENTQVLNLLSQMQRVVTILTQLFDSATAANNFSLFFEPELNQNIKLFFIYRKTLAEVNSNINEKISENYKALDNAVRHLEAVFSLPDIHSYFIIDQLKSYNLCPTEFSPVFAMQQAKAEVKLIPCDLPVIPYKFLDNLIEAVNNSSLPDEAIFTLAHALLQIPKTNTGNITQTCQHYALMLLIAQHARYLTQGNSTSVESLTTSNSSMPALKTPTSLLILPKALCIELILLWQKLSSQTASSDQALAIELRLLFAIFQSQMLLPDDAELIYQQRLNSLCRDHFHAVACRRLKFDPQSTPLATCQSQILPVMQTRISAHLVSSLGPSQFLDNLLGFCALQVTSGPNGATHISDDKRLIDCILNGGYEWDKVEFPFTFIEYIENRQGIVPNFAVYLLLRDYLGSRRGAQALENFKSNVAQLQHNIANDEIPARYTFEVDSIRYTIDHNRSFIDDLLFAFMATVIKKDLNEVIAKLIRILYNAMLAIKDIPVSCQIKPLTWAYSLLFLMKASPKSLTQYQLITMDLNWFTDLMHYLIDESYLSLLLNYTLPLLFNSPYKKSTEVLLEQIVNQDEVEEKCLVVNPKVISKLPTTISSHSEETTSEALKSLPKDILASLPQGYSPPEELIAYIIIMALINRRQARDLVESFDATNYCREDHFTELHMKWSVPQTHKILRSETSKSVMLPDPNLQISSNSYPHESQDRSPSAHLNPSFSSSQIDTGDSQHDFSESADQARDWLSSLNWLLTMYNEARRYAFEQTEVTGALATSNENSLNRRAPSLSSFSLTAMSSSSSDPRDPRLFNPARREASVSALPVTRSNSRMSMSSITTSNGSTKTYQIHYLQSLTIALIQATLDEHNQDETGKLVDVKREMLINIINGVAKQLLEMALEQSGPVASSDAPAAPAPATVYKSSTEDHPLEYALILLILLKQLQPEMTLSPAIAGTIFNAFEAYSGKAINSHPYFVEVKTLFATLYAELDASFQSTNKVLTLNQRLLKILTDAVERRIKPYSIAESSALRQSLVLHAPKKDKTLYVNPEMHALIQQPKPTPTFTIKLVNSLITNKPKAGEIFLFEILRTSTVAAQDAVVYTYKIAMPGDGKILQGNISYQDLTKHIDPNEVAMLHRWIQSKNFSELQNLIVTHIYSQLGYKVTEVPPEQRLALQKSCVLQTIQLRLVSLRLNALEEKTAFSLEIHRLLVNTLEHENHALQDTLKPLIPSASDEQISPSRRLPSHASQSAPSLVRLSDNQSAVTRSTSVSQIPTDGRSSAMSSPTASPSRPSSSTPAATPPTETNSGCRIS